VHCPAVSQGVATQPFGYQPGVFVSGLVCTRFQHVGNAFPGEFLAAAIAEERARKLIVVI